LVKTAQLLQTLNNQLSELADLRQLLALDGLAELVKVVLGFRQIGLHQRAAGVEVKTAQLLQTLNNQLSELAAQVAPLAEHATLSPRSAIQATCGNCWRSTAWRSW
jgi:hypothetical protein